MDGLEVLETIKSDPDLSRIPVVILTTSTAEADIVKAYDSHANSYLVKPVDFPQFVKLMDALGYHWLPGTNILINLLKEVPMDPTRIRIMIVANGPFPVLIMTRSGNEQTVVEACLRLFREKGFQLLIESHSRTNWSQCPQVPQEDFDHGNSR